MFVVQSLPAAIVFCVITMLGWGSWANTQKLAGKEKWPFELFYWGAFARAQHDPSVVGRFFFKQ